MNKTAWVTWLVVGVFSTCGLSLLACSSSGDQKPYLQVEDEQSVVVGDTEVQLVLRGKHGAVVLTVPALATKHGARVTARLVSGLVMRGAVPVQDQAVELIPSSLRFDAPVRMRQSVPVPARGRYIAVVAPPGTTEFVTRLPGARVGAPNGTEEDWEIDVDGAGVWGMALDDGSVDAGAEDEAGAQADWVVQDEAQFLLTTRPRTLMLGTGLQRARIEVPAQPMDDPMPVVVQLVSRVRKTLGTPTNGTAVRVAPRVQPIAVPMRVQQTVPAEPVIFAQANGPQTHALTTPSGSTVTVITSQDADVSWTRGLEPRFVLTDTQGETWEMDVGGAGLYAFVRATQATPDAGVPDAASPDAKAAVDAPLTAAVTAAVAPAAATELGTALTLTAKVSVSAGSLMGTATFTSDLTGPLGTVAVNAAGDATSTITCGLKRGSHQIAATYKQQSTNVAATSAPVTHVVSRGTPVFNIFSFNPQASDYWRGLSFGFSGCAASLTDPLAGATLSFYDDGALVLQYVGGLANQTVNANVPFGKQTFNFSAVYSGNADLLPVTVMKSF